MDQDAWDLWKVLIPTELHAKNDWNILVYMSKTMENKVCNPQLLSEAFICLGMFHLRCLTLFKHQWSSMYRMKHYSLPKVSIASWCFHRRRVGPFHWAGLGNCRFVSQRKCFKSYLQICWKYLNGWKWQHLQTTNDSNDQSILNGSIWPTNLNQFPVGLQVYPVRFSHTRLGLFRCLTYAMDHTTDEGPLRHPPEMYPKTDRL